MSSDNGDTTEKLKSGGDGTQVPPAAGDWVLREQLGDQSYPLQTELIIGREEGCDVVLTSGHASRKHAKIVFADGEAHVVDLNSSNGTYVNGERVEKAKLKSGDELRFDTQLFTVEGPAVEEVDEPAPQSTVLRPAVTDPPTIEATPAPEPKAAPEEPKAAPEEPKAAPEEPKAEPQPEEEARGKAWWESHDEGPKGTKLVDSDAIRDQFQAGGTQIVRGVENLDIPSLIGTMAPCAGKVFKLEKEATVVGRSENSDIIVDEGSISARHAQVVREGGTWKVVDLLSANGTFVNGKKSQVAFLSPGDAIRFGRVEMRFVLGDTDVPSAAEPEELGVIRGSGGRKKGVPVWVFALVGFLIVAAVSAVLFL